MRKRVYVVHSIDTEGPLNESLSSTFERLEELFGIGYLPRTRETLAKLQTKQIDLGDKLSSKIAEALSGHRLRINGTWTEVLSMLDRIMTDSFRQKLPDSLGQGWVYNWHCIDLVGYENNPRRRDLGYHNIFDRYIEIMGEYPSCPDGLHFHFHPVSIYRDAHRCATSYINSPEFWQVLCRKILERNWFPTVFRAGFQAERPDSHWILEQWIPFDISNMATDTPEELEMSVDFRKGRSGDWRRAPSDWSIYHPDHDDYQKAGNCRRVIARSLNVMSRIASINQNEVDKAFERANSGKPTLMGFCSHDYRDIGVEVNHIRDMIEISSRRYPEVEFEYAEALHAFRQVMECDMSQPALDFNLNLHSKPENDVPYLEIRTITGKTFGPQPFLALETKSRRFIHDNLDFGNEPGVWYYAFHGDTLPLSDVRRIGVASNDALGNTCIRTINVADT
jgi:hypothetical protein